MIATTTVLILALNLARGSSTPALQNDPVLTKIANERCVELKSWSHDGFEGLRSRMVSSGRHAWGENLALNFPDPMQIVPAFEGSPTHRDNNHNPRYRRVGIATCRNAAVNTYADVWVFLFSDKPQRI